MKKILLVEDDRKGARTLKRGLEEDGFAVDVVEDGASAEQVATAGHYDLVVLDWLLPGKSGIDICRDLRTGGLTLPILMLTARDALSDRVAGLDTGADDYLTKPFAYSELLARIRALTRRTTDARSATVTIADLTLDPVTHVVTRRGQPVSLTVTEYAILHTLVRRAGQVVSRRELLDALPRDEPGNPENLLEVYISRLRKKLDGGADVALIHTVRGRGYSLGGARP
jgi:DNA-binding response OmpR family regulator